MDCASGREAGWGGWADDRSVGRSLRQHREMLHRTFLVERREFQRDDVMQKSRLLESMLIVKTLMFSSFIALLVGRGVDTARAPT